MNVVQENQFMRIYYYPILHTLHSHNISGDEAI